MPAGTILSNSPIARTDLKQDEAWIALPFNHYNGSNEWRNYGSEYESCAYRKYQYGHVHLKGLAARVGNPTDNWHVGFLPVGYRPASISLWGNYNTGAMGRMDCNPNGTLSRYYSPTTTDSYVQLDGIYFDTEEQGPFSPTYPVGAQPSNTQIEGKRFVPSAWATIALGNPDATFATGVTNFGGGHYACAYMKDAAGWVHLRGLAVTATKKALAADMFTLPAGFRPSAVHVFTTIANNALATLVVLSDGLVRWQTGSAGDNAWIPFNGFCFPSAAIA